LESCKRCKLPVNLTKRVHFTCNCVTACLATPLTFKFHKFFMIKVNGNDAWSNIMKYYQSKTGLLTLFERHWSRSRKCKHSSTEQWDTWCRLHCRSQVHLTFVVYDIRFIHVSRKSHRVDSMKLRTYAKKYSSTISYHNAHLTTSVVSRRLQL